ncbi:MAG: sugar transporter permease [Lacrimispora sp.]|jgi:putative aldouronate transport system permease protein|nr:sugar transporter permease [Lacrimispora sp.]
MKVKKSKGERAFSVFNYIFLTLLIVLCLYPVWYVAVASFSNSNLLTQHTGLLIKPVGWSIDAYKKVFKNPMIGRGYLNTLFILVVGVFLDLIMTSLGAYFLSRKRVMFKRPIMLLIVFTMFFSGGMIPFYLNLKDLRMTNSLWGLIVPFMISTYNLIILRTSFESIPESLIEAAQIDGASHITILMQIVIPLSKAILAVMVLYYGVSIWNSWFWASAIIRTREMYPLQVILREILMQNDVSSMTAGSSALDTEAIGMTIKYATIIVATVPILCVYPFLQKHFTKGTMIGAVKE